MVFVDKAKCISCGICFTTHANVFTMWADGKAEVKEELKDKKNEELTQIEKDDYEAAKTACPVGAIE